MGVFMKDLNLQATQGNYINVMEQLVTQEVEQQLQCLPARIRRYIRLEEVVTFALNRLPALYASSEKGLEYQYKHATRSLKQPVKDAVRQAIAAVQVDPLRLTKPILLDQDESAAAVLDALRSLFQIPDLDWETALEQINTLAQTSQIPEETPSHTPHTGSHVSATAGYPSKHEEPWVKRQHHGSSHHTNLAKVAQKHEVNGEMGWDDPRYRH